MDPCANSHTSVLTLQFEVHIQEMHLWYVQDCRRKRKIWKALMSLLDSPFIRTGWKWRCWQKSLYVHICRHPSCESSSTSQATEKPTINHGTLSSSQKLVKRLFLWWTSWFKWKKVHYLQVCGFVCAPVCVCKRERERERESVVWRALSPVEAGPCSQQCHQSLGWIQCCSAWLPVIIVCW